MTCIWRGSVWSAKELEEPDDFKKFVFSFVLWLGIILYFALTPSYDISLHFLVILQDHCFFLLSLFSALSPFFPLKRRRNLPSPVHDELPLAVEEGADWPCCLAPCWCWLWWWWGGGGGYNYEEGINGGDNENAVRGVNKYTFRGKNENMLSVMIFLPYYFPHNHSFQTSQRWPVTLQPDHWYLESPLLHQLLSLSKAILQPVHYYSWKNSFPIFVSYFSKKVFLIFSNQLLSFSKPSHGTSWFSFKEEPPQHHDKSEAIPT